MGNIALTDVIPQDSLERQLYFIEKCKTYVADLQEKLGRPLTCCTQTFGCQMNARDSEKLLGILTEIGYVPVETEEADLVLYNTCTVRENANLRVYGRLGHLNGLKKKNPHMIIALCGCMMQETQVVEKIKQSYRFVDIMYIQHFQAGRTALQQMDTGRPDYRHLGQHKRSGGRTADYA